MKLLIDTDVLIDYLRGVELAVDYLQSTAARDLCLSAITVAELYAGVKEGKEKTILSHFFDAFEIFPITHDIATQGGLWRRDYGKSHGTGLVDALIAATVNNKKISLITLNKKHYPMLSNIIVPYKKS